MQVGVQALRHYEPARIVVGVPVAAPEACQLLSRSADAVVCMETPSEFRAVGKWYRDFEQTTDQEVIELLAPARHDQALSRHAS